MIFLTTLAYSAILVAHPSAESPKALAAQSFLEQVASVSTDFKNAAKFFVALQPSKALPQSRVLKSIKEYSFRWVGKTVRPEFADKLLKAAWTGFPNDIEPKECIVASVPFKDGRFYWSDYGPAAAVLIEFETMTPLEDEAGRKAFVSSMLDRVFLLPDRPKESIRDSVELVSSKPGPLWGGYVLRGASESSDGKMELPRAWDCRFLFITDGQRVLIRFNPIEDHPVEGSGRAWKPGDKFKSRFDD